MRVAMGRVGGVVGEPRWGVPLFRGRKYRVDPFGHGGEFGHA